MRAIARSRSRGADGRDRHFRPSAPPFFVPRYASPAARLRTLK